MSYVQNELDKNDDDAADDDDDVPSYDDDNKGDDVLNETVREAPVIWYFEGIPR